MKSLEYIYGIHSVSDLLLHSPGRVEQLFIVKHRHDKRYTQLMARLEESEVKWRYAPVDDIDTMLGGSSDYNINHQGVVAACTPLPVLDDTGLKSLIKKHMAAFSNLENEGQNNAMMILILDGVRDPHNLGAVLRSALASGVNVVIAPKDNAVGLTPTAAKVACGAAELVPFAQVTNLARTMRMLQDEGVWIVGTSDAAESLLYDIDMKGHIAIVLGSEDTGIRKNTKTHCDYLAKLPTRPEMASLNVSVATGICLFEAVRQRQPVSPPPEGNNP